MYFPPAWVSPEELVPHAGQDLHADHLQPGLEGVVHLDLALLGEDLEPTGLVGGQVVLTVHLHLTGGSD